MNTISIIGLGYIGLPTATLFASRKLRVIGIDVSPYVVDTINRGDIHIVEPELDILVQAAVGAGYLRAATQAEPADAFVIAVPTPLTSDHRPDLNCIESAAKSIAPVLSKGNLVILESTSPVGTTEMLANWLAEMRPDLSFPQQVGDDSDIRIAYCPERVLPGRIVHELVVNDRVIGGMTRGCSDAAVALYKSFVQGDCIVTDVRTAEMCKLTENSFRDVNIAFANELSMICDKQGIDVWELIKLANRHPRVNILQPSCGVGGHCIAVDPWFIVDSAPDESTLIQAARRVNDAKPQWVIGKVTDAIARMVRSGFRGRDICIAFLGITYKADIDDLRESPALKIAETVVAHHQGRVAVVDPNFDDLPKSLKCADAILMTLEEAVSQAHILVLLVDHAEFKDVKPDLSAMQVLIDTRGTWNNLK
ncbi:UDP-N-acetyl-D-mannosamine dehydrogenase [Burkholderia territorii]|uniref:UDP-N-acetyl-D-mannosamine dehydrogenase n=1 Tax=Burkholderia territorii TaxID=1503055 RepID=UPI0007592E0E|nr:UDP-N-acetyl-D-mannosamine dehydrogenase [Burkholderia territorii]KWE32520.1 UDP-N-acetyl-D-mannosaminuronic acid dehydrogenase [Burkholderia territorii]KWE42144.1 UDP-N-acetyl-D-mannosaminuronic acid dehydrogenase [Burkholderia territorii]KWE43814.1 UDP-N-acetyl-D-mannosaminuronic acid dehydrogenase [Burkholderia territorii]